PTAPAQVEYVAPPVAPVAMQQQPMANVPPISPQQSQDMYGQPVMGYDTANHNMNLNRNVNVQPVQFANFNQGNLPQVDGTNLNLLLDIPLKVTVELGRTQKQIKDILELSQG